MRCSARRATCIRWLLRAIMRLGLKGLFAPLLTLLGMLAGAFATTAAAGKTEGRPWVLVVGGILQGRLRTPILRGKVKTPVWPYQDSLSRLEQEHPAVAHPVRLGEFVDGPCTVAGEQLLRGLEGSKKTRCPRNAGILGDELQEYHAHPRITTFGFALCRGSLVHDAE